MNHDNEYHDDINYGNRFPEGWYYIRPEDSIPNYKATVEIIGKPNHPYNHVIWFDSPRTTVQH